jgi:hypothetical protein
MPNDEKFLLELSDPQSQNLSELHFSNTGKILLGLMGVAFFQGLTGAHIRGTPQQIDAIVEAMMTSRRFQEELRRPGASIDSVVEKLGLKNASAAQFERVLGIKWPL